MAAEQPPTLQLKIPGRRVEATLPRDAGRRARGAAEEQVDVFLPAGYLKPISTYELAPATRAPEVIERTDVAPGEVIALELQDGTTVYTSPENLRATLERVAPEAIGADGTLNLEGLRQRGVATRGVVADGVTNLVSRVFTLAVGRIGDPIIEDAKQRLAKFLGGKAEEKLGDYAELGVTWLGTKALMWAIENRLLREPGLYRWGARLDTKRLDGQDPELIASAAQGPLLVFIHGTGSNTEGGFGGLRSGTSDDWGALAGRYPGRIFAFEHHTLSESPIENAIALAGSLPKGARLHLVTHSRGGLVGDLLCLDQLADGESKLIDGYALEKVSLDQEAAERERLEAELEKVYGKQREQLHTLAKLLAEKQFRVERYVRVAAPSRGTRLASGNFDVFLSGLLALIGLVSGVTAQPLYSAFKRVVLEVAKNRTKPNLVPGIEAMLPESPMARLLARATPQRELELAVIAGDIEGGSLLKRLGVFFTDHVFFEAVQNDLVVDTDSMYAGVARPGRAHALFEQGPSVNHFRYFENPHSRAALQAWLAAEKGAEVETFERLPEVATEPLRREEKKDEEDLAKRRATRGGEELRLPIVVVLPGTMGSHLWRKRKDRIWLDPLDLIGGGLAEVRWGSPDISAEEIFSLFYGDLCKYLERTHRVERFPYDWRQPLDALADALAERLQTLVDAPDTGARPIRLLAHSMGGLVVRALVARHRPLWDALLKRDGARFVMLGTPNQGSHSLVEALLGKSKTLRMLARADVKNGLQKILDIVAGFPGALQLLPKPGFVDTDQPEPGRYFEAEFWSEIQPEMRDFWFGNGLAAKPRQADLDAGRWLWQRDGLDTPSLPAATAERVIYVNGCAESTPCGIEKKDGRWKLLGTGKGDGTVTWASGQIGGIGKSFWMPAEHGSLADTKEYFGSLAELLERGTPGRLLTSAPTTRAAAAAMPVAYDAGPPGYPTEQDLASGLLGAPKRVEGALRELPTLEVGVQAMDLRWLTRPILVGHFERDAISGAEAIVDRDLVKGQLSVRYNLGIYAGALGTCTIALFAPNEEERSRRSQRGAIVAGLGPYDGTLDVKRLTESVRLAALRYLVHLTDGGDGVADTSAPVQIATLLLGYNSSASLSIADSVGALVRGVAEANRKFAETAGSTLRIGSLKIVELFLDTAISTTYEVKRLAAELAEDDLLGCRVVAGPELTHGDGFRQRLESDRDTSYWPRLHVSSLDSPDETSEPKPAAEPQGERKNGFRYLFVGARARAEVVLQELQPGLAEKLGSKPMDTLRYSTEISRTLFELLIPPDLKDTVRRTGRMVLVVDAAAANHPWELIQADGEPLAANTALVRQLATPRFRRHIRQSVEKRAYVVGNPSTRDFAKFFKGFRLPKEQTALPPLPAAEHEASEVERQLQAQGLEVVSAIGLDWEATDVITRLHRDPYRIVHIAAHGVFQAKHEGGGSRTGVVLSDGLLITAQEIGALENVPDLVFLNCCKLARMEASADYTGLAYSVARELIESGVRAVVVAGWEVEDEASRHFATTFYDHLLQDGMDFGSAVFEARSSTYQQYPETVTWGAYQAYGDPGWRFDPKRDPYAAGSGRARPFVDPEELLAQLDGYRTSISCAGRDFSAEELAETASQVKALVESVPHTWLERAEVCNRLADLHAELGTGYFPDALGYYEKAIGSAETQDASIRAIEQLANIESRHGESEGNVLRIQRAIGRLDGLARVVLGADPAHVAEDELERLGSERLGLLGSAYKSLAGVLARQVAGDAGKVKAMEDAVLSSARYYGARASDPASNPYGTLNQLSLVALKVAPGAVDASIALARRCGAQARKNYQEKPDVWSAVGSADALLVERLFDGSLAAPGDSKVEAELARKYAAALTGVPVTPKQRNSIVRQIALLTLFYRAKSAEDPRALLVSERLRRLANGLIPNAGDDAVRLFDELPAAPAVSAKRGPEPRRTNGSGKRQKKPKGKGPKKR